MRIKVKECDGAYFKYEASQKGWFKPWIWGFGDTPEKAIKSFKENYIRRFPPKKSKKSVLVVDWNPKEDN